MPCWNTEFFLVLQMIRSAHWTTTMEPKKMAWPEAILTKDDKIDKEASRCLDHTDLAISHGDQALVNEFVCEGVPWRPLHDVRFSLFIGHGDGGHHVGSQVDAEDGDSTEGQGHVSKDEEKEGGDLRDV